MGWTDTAVATVAADPAAVVDLFPAAARHARAEGLDGEAVRVALLRATGDRLPDVVGDLYRHGDGAEKRAVVAGLNELADRVGPTGLPVVRDAGLPIVRDALRSNDTGLVGRAMGAYAARELDQPAWRQGVVKCLFTGVPLAHVARLHERADDELRRMVADLLAEREAAGRPAIPDAVALLDPARA